MKLSWGGSVLPKNARVGKTSARDEYGVEVEWRSLELEADAFRRARYNVIGSGWSVAVGWRVVIVFGMTVMMAIAVAQGWSLLSCR
jgi:hypothetical protein